MPLLTTGRCGWVALVLLLVLLSAGTAESAKPADQPQCSDGVDNDGDGTVDGGDVGCVDGYYNDEAGTPYQAVVVVTLALPSVTIVGAVRPSGAIKVSRFRIRAARGSRVSVTCAGSKCPFRTRTRTMKTTTVRLHGLERKLKPTITLKVRIARTKQVGRYVRYKVRPKRTPRRTDRCFAQATGKVTGCYADQDQAAAVLATPGDPQR